MVKHTLGPWMVFDWTTSTGGTRLVGVRPVADEPGDICQVWGEFDKVSDRPNEESVANARLIAAAPDMLEVLVKLEYWFDTDEEVLSAMSNDERRAHERMWEMIRTVINKADG